MKRSVAPIREYARRKRRLGSNGSNGSDEHRIAALRRLSRDSQALSSNLTENHEKDGNLRKLSKTEAQMSGHDLAPGSPSLEEFSRLDELTESLISAIAGSSGAATNENDTHLASGELAQLSEDCRKAFAYTVMDDEDDAATLKELPRHEIVHLILRTVQQVLTVFIL
ncbi:uncharacterized protein LOC112347229 isoform X1 [Selaginella moellendorffii]|uniref:uncharacterized protein LOC112347229 isoform X1 n=1 Tax=Selaginella moellendorffii TaxID=88036 RepID=UPI000D1CA33B|nr:uncharacterized protein LOC112347229 isoform X1 [Selaginella moellendorffii]|eukprot:XP_024533548.1 uncharacterized protein LOC112347229 isoform X1 [Selaginella moellendorffii]